MLSISTIPESLVELEKQTGRAWTESELFDVATQRGVSLHAAVPIDAYVTIQKWVDGEGLVQKYLGTGHAALAVLFPWQVGQLWLIGKTVTSHPRNHDEVEGEFKLFIEPVSVIREQVRITQDSLKQIISVWVTAQAGRWISDAKQANGMRWQRGPDWMFPAESQPPAQNLNCANKVVVPATVWTVKKPKKWQGYIKPLFDYLTDQSQQGHGKPTARDFLDAMKKSQPADIVEVMNDGLKYQTGKETKVADLDAIRKAIARMTADSAQ